jgi:acyl dehydratase
MPSRVFTDSPSLLPLYLRAAAPSVPGLSRVPGLQKPASGALPDTTFERRGVRIDREHLTAYNQVCGFSAGPTLPATYLHLAAFPLHLALMVDPAFPFPAMGMVHLRNQITVHRALGADARYDLSVRATDQRPHPRGTVVVVSSEATRDGELVWSDESVVLARGRRDESVPWPDEDVPEAAPVGPVIWSLPGDLGRRYGSVSGDRNPIHLYDVTARLFGFKRHIVHGMWSKARCLAELSNRLPERYTVNVGFRKPIELPGRVRFGAGRRDGIVDFGLTGDPSGVEHLSGRVTTLD